MWNKSQNIHANLIRETKSSLFFSFCVLVHLLCCETYNIHDSQDVLLDVPATVVAHHHLVGHHQRLHVALPAHGALQRQLAAAYVMGRRLQSPLPPRRALHRLLV